MGFVYEPKVAIEFTKAEILIMQDCSEQHYDGRCREASQQGGLVHLLVKFSVVNTPIERIFTFGELDLMAKIVEPCFPNTKEQSMLFLRIVSLLKQLNAESIRLNSKKEI